MISTKPAPFSMKYLGVSIENGKVSMNGLRKRQMNCLVLGPGFLIAATVAAWYYGLDFRHADPEILGGFVVGVGMLLVAGIRNESTIDLQTGEVRQTRGFLFLTKDRVFVSAQIDGIIRDMIQAETAESQTNRTFGKVELRAGLLLLPIFEGSPSQAYDLARSLSQTLNWPILDSHD